MQDRGAVLGQGGRPIGKGGLGGIDGGTGACGVADGHLGDQIARGGVADGQASFGGEIACGRQQARIVQTFGQSALIVKHGAPPWLGARVAQAGQVISLKIGRGAEDSSGRACRARGILGAQGSRAVAGGMSLTGFVTI